MADILPPAPVDAQFGSYNWQDWYVKVRNAINSAASISWSQITDFTGSNLTQLATRSHQSLQNILGNGVGHIPAAGSAGQVLSKINATDYNTQWVTPTVIPVSSGPIFRAHSNAGTSMPTANTPAKIAFQVTEFDTASAYSSNRFLPLQSGYYLVQGTISTGASTTYIVPYIYKNGASYAIGNTAAVASTGTYISNVNDIVFLNGTTDYVEIWGQSGVISSTGGGTLSDTFSAVWLHS